MIRFFSRVAFICNVLFILSVALQYRSFIEDETIVSNIIILGYFLAVFFFNPLVNILYATFLIIRRKLYQFVPKWLVLANFIMLIVQILYIIFILNDTVHY